mmetsp:Transcript_49353/g.105006  ORF Transcript_49353/g.105006 Transcript_49353/m.105006 type:complete len:239 (+) Transcript_49353:915-1631(+)
MGRKQSERSGPPFASDARALFAHAHHRVFDGKLVREPLSRPSRAPREARGLPHVARHVSGWQGEPDDGQSRRKRRRKGVQRRQVRQRTHAPWHDATRHDATWHDAARHDWTRHDVWAARHDAPRHDAPGHDAAWDDAARHDWPHWYAATARHDPIGARPVSGTRRGARIRPWHASRAPPTPGSRAHRHATKSARSDPDWPSAIETTSGKRGPQAWRPGWLWRSHCPYAEGGQREGPFK